MSFSSIPFFSFFPNASEPFFPNKDNNPPTYGMTSAISKASEYFSKASPIFLHFSSFIFQKYICQMKQKTVLTTDLYLKNSTVQNVQLSISLVRFGFFPPLSTSY